MCVLCERDFDPFNIISFTQIKSIREKKTHAIAVVREDLMHNLKLNCTFICFYVQTMKPANTKRIHSILHTNHQTRDKIRQLIHLKLPNAVFYRLLRLQCVCRK